VQSIDLDPWRNVKADVERAAVRLKIQEGMKAA
jgi:hypothetical protein